MSRVMWCWPVCVALALLCVQSLCGAAALTDRSGKPLHVPAPLRAVVDSHSRHPMLLKLLLSTSATGRAIADPTWAPRMAVDRRHPRAERVRTARRTSTGARATATFVPPPAVDRRAPLHAVAPLIPGDCGSPRPAGTPPPSEVAALQRLFECTGGRSSWADTTGWSATNMSAAAVCSGAVYGVNCTSLTDGTRGPRIRGLDLGNNGLFGVLPDVFDAFADLQVFIAYFNRLSGVLPPSFDALPSLLAYQLSNNEIAGALPNMTASARLMGVYAGSNFFAGSIPAYDHAPGLQVVEVYDNELAGPHPAFAAHTQLTSIYVSQNELNGPVPSLRHLTRLSIYAVNVNSLDGPVPDLSAQPALFNVYFSDNNFTGPWTLAHLPNPALAVTQLVTEANAMSGALPAFGAAQFPLLQILNVGANRFTGPIPDSITALPELYYLDLGGNRLTGSVPTAFVSPHFQFLDISANALTGLPIELLRSTTLFELVMGFNAGFAYAFATDANGGGLNCQAIDNSSLGVLDARNIGLTGDLVNAMDCLSRWLPKVTELVLSGNDLYTSEMDGELRLNPTKYLIRLRSIDLSANALNVSLAPALFGSLPSSYYGPFVSLVDMRHNPRMAFVTGYSFVYEPQTDRFLVDSATNLTCPARLFPLLQLEMRLDPGMWNYVLCNCPIAWYFNALLLRCTPCLTNLQCSTLATNALPVSAAAPRPTAAATYVADGYYPLYVRNASFCPIASWAVNVSAASLPIVLNADGSLFDPAVLPTVRLACIAPAACTVDSPELSATYHCASGVEDTSLLCSKCRGGYYALDNTCVECNAAHRVLIPLSWVLCGVILVAYVAYTDYSARGSALVGVCLFWLQLSATLAASSSTGGAGTGGSNTKWATAFGWQEIVSFRPFAWECVFPGADFVAFYWLQFSLLVALASAALLATLYRRCWGPVEPPPGMSGDAHSSVNSQPSDSGVGVDYKALTDAPAAAVVSSATPPPELSAPVSSGVGRDRSSAVSRFLFFCYFVLDLLYLPLATRVLQLFACDDQRAALTDVSGADADTDASANAGALHYLIAAPYVSCQSESYKAMLGMGVVTFFVYVIGWPTYCLLRMYGVRHSLDACALRHELGFLWSASERSRAWWWYVMVMNGRKLVLAVVVTQLPPSSQSIAIPVAVSALITLVVLLTLLTRPYVQQSETWIEIALLALASITYQTDMWASLASSSAVANNAAERYASNRVQNVQMVVNDIVKSLMLLYVARYYYLRCREKRCTRRCCNDADSEPPAPDAAGDDDRAPKAPLS